VRGGDQEYSNWVLKCYFLDLHFLFFLSYKIVFYGKGEKIPAFFESHFSNLVEKLFVLKLAIFPGIVEGTGLPEYLVIRAELRGHREIVVKRMVGVVEHTEG